MNEQLYRYILNLIEQGVNNPEQLKPRDRRAILGLILIDSEEPINFLTETDCHKRFIEKMISYLTGLTCDDQFMSILDIYSELEDSALEYNKDKIDDTFNQVKVDMNDYINS